MTKKKSMGRPKDFPDQQTDKVAGYILVDAAKWFIAFVQLSTINQALKAALEEFLERHDSK